MNGSNTSKRSSNLGGNNKRKKENIARMEKNFLSDLAEKDKKVKDKKAAAEAKVMAKRKAREAARLLDIEHGFIDVDDDQNSKGDSDEKSTIADMTWGSYLCRGVVLIKRSS